jgi:hypothetical protein
VKAGIRLPECLYVNLLSQRLIAIVGLCSTDDV